MQRFLTLEGLSITDGTGKSTQGIMTLHLHRYSIDNDYSTCSRYNASAWNSNLLSPVPGFASPWAS